MTKRFEELDSLRGLAAISVLFSHLAIATDITTKDSFMKMIDRSPFHIVYAGHEAVIFFFILSGFVLSLPAIRGRKTIYSDFIIKRIARIYIPVIIMISIALIALMIIKITGISNAQGWLANMWQSDVSIIDVINNVMLIGFFDYNSLNPVIWSLVHEMRISFVFPIIIMLLLKMNWKKSLVFALAISAVGGTMHILWGSGHISIGKSLHYTAMFIVGAILARNMERIVSFFNNKSKRVIMAYFILAVLAYTYTFWFLPNISIIHNTLIDDWMTAIGASLFIMLALSSVMFSKILKLKWVYSLGQISFSLYLLHLIVMLFIFNLFNGVLPVWILVIASITISIILSAINYKYVEKYSMSLGRNLLKNHK